MNTLKRLGRTLMLLLTLTFVGNLLIVPQAAHAGGDGKKKPHIPIIVGPPIIKKDPPKKRDGSEQTLAPTDDSQNLH